ncbi:MAG: translational activator of GCN4 [Thelocarpon superellum]|nr:MAG: translational activator of GCN4 [Thelocarpon superellum]
MGSQGASTELGVHGVKGLQLQSISAQLASSSTNRRTAELVCLRETLANDDVELSPETVARLLLILFQTYAYYQDRPSRRAVQQVLLTLCAHDAAHSHVPFLLDHLKSEAAKPGLAPSNAFVLVEWCALLLLQCSQAPKLWQQCGRDILQAHAQVLELCLATSKRRSVKQAALVVTRRALRKIFLAEETGPSAVGHTVKLLTTDTCLRPASRYAVLLGVVAGVGARLTSTQPLVAACKKDVYAFYLREVVGSRTLVPPHIARALHDFFAAYATLDDLRTEVVPALEKALLRAPELVLPDIIVALIQAVPTALDLSDVVQGRLLKPLLSNVKSTNATIRAGALRTFEAAMPRCHDEARLDALAMEILEPLRMSKLSHAEQRVVHAEMLRVVPPTTKVASKIAQGVSAVASKEPNESVLSAESATIVTHLCYGVQKGQDVDKAIQDALTRGLADKKVPVRRIWAVSIGELFWQCDDPVMKSPPVLALVKLVLPKLEMASTEVIANPLHALQSGLLTAAYVMTALGPARFLRSDDAAVVEQVSKTQISRHALTLDPKPSFLLNHRVYTKLHAPDQWTWFLRALMALVSEVSATTVARPVSDAWAQAVLYLIASTTVSHAIRRDTLHALTVAYLQHPARIGATMVAGLWQWWRSVEHGDKDTAAAAAKTNNDRLYLVVRAIAVTPGEAAQQGRHIEQTIVEGQLADMLVLCRPELLPRVHWIETCQRAGVDPGQLARSRSSLLLDQIVAVTEIAEDGASPLPSLCQAAYNAAAELAFVAPDVMTDLIVRQLEQDLDPAQLEGVGPLEAAIYRTPAGTACVDVLAKHVVHVPDRNVKDYDTLRWEEELRAQLASKKGQTKKLTADEQSRVNAQLVKEADIRQRLAAVQLRLARGTGLIFSLATGPPTEAERWLGPAVHLLIEATLAGASLLTGLAPTEAYLAMAQQVSARLGTVRRSLGLATIRALGPAPLPAALEEEPLGDLVTRVLYRLRFTGEQRPFDTVSLLYMLPLIFRVLRHGGVGKEASDETDEQVVLALEFLSFHTDTCADPRLPRGEIVQVLISSMQRYTQHYKIIKDCLLDLCRCIAANMSETELDLLVQGAVFPDVSVRTAVLQTIRAEADLTDRDFCKEIWLAYHDDVEENAKLAHIIWEENALDVDEDSVLELVPYLSRGEKSLRRAAARAMAAAVATYPSTFARVLERLRAIYVEAAKPPRPQLDEYGMQKRAARPDPWELRSGIATTFKELAVIFDPSLLLLFITFLIDDGPLGDRSAVVRDEMADAATAIIATHGQKHVEALMKLFERTLEAPDSHSEVHDWINEAVIILYGALARHLKAGDARVPTVVQRLLTTLSTPSETVQAAVAECLPPLIRASPAQTSDYLRQMLTQLVEAKAYAARRGAAYGLAGIVRGKGIIALRDHRIMSTIKTALEDKKDPHHRQGALMAYELYALVLGPVFEPYVIQIVPQLLGSFGDPSTDVRDACLDAAKTCFATLSSFGVQQILPTLLEGLDEPQWRSKKGACDLLGAMAYLDPQQLAQRLPEIIPPLTTVLNDSHKEVRLAANRSLQRFGEVISNPEVKTRVGVLLKALSDPTKYTDEALDGLIQVSFMHYLDAPSLALIVRILERGLSDRSSTKRKAAQIIGSLAHLTERKDLVQHLGILTAGLKQAIVDPVPTTRATASKALGSLIEKLGEEALPDLIPSLMATLRSDTGAGDRLGSAQALAEVLAGLGTVRLEETLPTILQNVSSAKPAVREGFMSLFIFLPACFGNSFAAYLSKIIPPILTGLADDVESIRDTSLRAGRLLVKNFATRAIDLLLPELERGLADDSHRIRLSSVELVGDLLFNLTGISGAADEDEAADEGAAEAGQSLLEVLGEDKRNRVLSLLYICRCDTSGLVRSAAIGVWKALVASPRTLRDIIPTLTQLLIRRLASPKMEQKVIAGNALGELIRKAGEGVLATLLPPLEEGLQSSTDTDAKQGICIALRELISSASSDALEDYEKTLISVVRTALVDPDADVRDAAAEAFDSLQHIFGKRAVDQVLPHLLSLLRTEAEAEHALAALLTLLTDNTRSNIILPNLIPTLLTTPISSFNAKALASLAQVAGPAMTRRLPTILNTLMQEIVRCQDDGLRADLDDSFDAVLVSIDEHDGLSTAMSVILALVKHDDHRTRAAMDLHLATFFRQAEIDLTRYYPDLIRVLLISFDDRDPDVVRAAWQALHELTKRLKKEEMEALVVSTRQVLQGVGVAGSDLPGFSLPKGLNAILPIFLQGLMNGSTEQRTQSALAIADLVDRTSPEALRPFVTQITGPLIRVVSERSVEVKAAVMLTMNHLLEKIPAYLKPFLPQLQRTFAKSLADTSSDVLRSRAAKALGTLITLTPRIDPLIAELVTGSKTPDLGVRNAMLKALFEVVSKAGGNMSDVSRNMVLALTSADIDDTDDTLSITNARLLGALIPHVPAEGAPSLLKQRVLTTHFSKASVLALNSVLLEAPSTLTDGPLASDTANVICQGINSKNPFIADNCVLAGGKYLLTPGGTKSFETNKSIVAALAQVIQPGHPVDTRRLALVVIRTVSRLHGDLIKPHLAVLAPPVFASVRDLVIPVKLSAEAAFLAIFSVVEAEGAVFEKYHAGPGATLPPLTKKSMQDYFKRVALRLASQSRERREAEGGQGGLGLSGDERDDEREVWSVGKVDLGEGQFGADD